MEKNFFPYSLVDGMVLTSSKFAERHYSQVCRHPSMDGLPGASTMLNLMLADLSLKETFEVATSRFSIVEPPYPLRTLLHGRIVMGDGKCWRSMVVIYTVRHLLPYLPSGSCHRLH